MVRRVAGARYTRAARQVHSLFIEVNELTDRSENALKFIGDIYAARLFWLVAERLGLGTWKADVETKLKTLDDIYRFAVEQSAMSRGQFLELTIVLILVLELVLFFHGHHDLASRQSSVDSISRSRQSAVVARESLRGRQPVD